MTHEAVDGGQVILDRAREQLNVDDDAVGLGHQVDHLSHREVLAVAQRQHGAGNDLVRIACLIEPHPDVAGLVLVGEVDVDLTSARFVGACAVICTSFQFAASGLSRSSSTSSTNLIQASRPALNLAERHDFCDDCPYG